jgi:hypothetical protein
VEQRISVEAGGEEKRISLAFDPENTSIRFLIDITLFISVIKAY